MIGTEAIVAIVATVILIVTVNVCRIGTVRSIYGSGCFCMCFKAMTFLVEYLEFLVPGEHTQIYRQD